MYHTHICNASTNRKNEKKAAKLEFTGNIVYIEDLLEAQVTDEDRKKLSDIKANALDIDPLYAIFTSGSTGHCTAMEKICNAWNNICSMCNIFYYDMQL